MASRLFFGLLETTLHQALAKQIDLKPGAISYTTVNPLRPTAVHVMALKGAV